MEENIGKKYLPIGTVVLLKGGEKKLMITGFYITEEGKEDTIWDYNGCFYPEGLIDSKQVFLFDHSQINEVYHIGFINDEEKEFKKALDKAIKMINDEGEQSKTEEIKREHT